METGFLDLATRRSLFARSLATSAEAGTVGRAVTDARLFDACCRFNALEQQKIRLLATKGGYDPWIELGRLSMSQAEHLEEVCASRATTSQGHRARILSFALWDEEGLAYRAAQGDCLEDRILHAIVRDLVRGAAAPGGRALPRR